VCGGSFVIVPELKGIGRPDLDFSTLPYPVALTGQRLCMALDTSADVLRTLFALKDCFEASLKYLVAVLLAGYRESPACTPENNEQLMEDGLVRPSLGNWRIIAHRLSGWLNDAEAPAGLAAQAFLQRRQSGGKPAFSRLNQECEAFVKYRNEALGHGAMRSEGAYRKDLDAWLPTLWRLLDAVSALAPWRLCLPTEVDQCEVWMGPAPGGVLASGHFSSEQLRHFVLQAAGGNGATVDLFPFLCYLPDSSQALRLHYYDSVHRYQQKRREANLLEYDNGYRYPRQEPIEGLERVFTRDQLSAAVAMISRRLELIEGRIAHFDELLAVQTRLVGRAWAIKDIQDFLSGQDRGLLVIEGQPGQGKTALLAHLIEHTFAHDAPVPVYFFYRRTAGITDPDVCVRSLYYALLAAHGLAEGESTRRLDDADAMFTKLTGLLSQIASTLSGSHRQLIFIDAADEADFGARRTAFARIPENLPAGVFIVVTTRHVTDRSELVRRPHLRWYDLNRPDVIQNNLVDGKLYVQQELEVSGVGDDVIDEVARAGAGNFLVLRLLCQHVRTQLNSSQVPDLLRRLATDGARDQLGFIYEEFWGRLLRGRPIDECRLLADILGVLVYARCPVTAELICGVLRLKAGEWDFGLRHLAEYLTFIPGEEAGAREDFYRLYHESFADFVRHRVGDDTRLLGLLADYCLKWEGLQGVPRRYALRFAREHLRLTRRWDDLERLLMDWRFLEAKVEEGLGFTLAGDFTALRESAPECRPNRRLLSLLEEAIRADLQFITRHPTTLFQCLWNRGWWYDPPRAKVFDQPSPAEVSFPGWEGSEPRLSTWLEDWRAGKEADQPGFRWVRSLRPPNDPLGTARRGVLSGHTARVPVVRYAPDGSRLASGSLDGTVRLWDAASGEELLVLEGHHRRVRSLTFSPDGKRLIVSTWDSTLHLWDLARNRHVRRWHTSANVSSVAFSADGRLLAVGLDNGRVLILDGTTYERRRIYRHRGGVEAVAFAPNGSALACAVADNSDSESCRHYIRIWSLNSDKHLRKFWSGTGPPSCLAFTPDGRTLVWGTYLGEVYSWEWGTRKRPRLLVTANDSLHALAVAPSGQEVAGASGPDVYIWTLASGSERCLNGHGDIVEDVAFSPDGSQLASASSDSCVFLWRTDWIDQAGGPPMPGQNDSVAFSPNGKYLALGPSHGEIELWTVGDWTRERRVLGTWHRVTSLAFSPDSQRLAFAPSDNVVYVWELDTGMQLIRLEGHTWRVSALAFSPDGNTIASGSWDDSVQVWDLSARRLIRRIQIQGMLNHVQSVTFTADGTHLLTGTWDGIARLWRLSDGHLVRKYEKHDGAITGAAWSADGRYLATSSWDEKVIVWEASSGAVMRVVPALGEAGSVAFGEPEGSWQARADSHETKILALPSEHAVAWFPPALSEIHTHPGGRIWAGPVKSRVYVFTVEGGVDKTIRGT
jgi:WD40 repeat protein